MAGIHWHHDNLVETCSDILGEDGTEIYGQETGETYSLETTKTPLAKKTPTIGLAPLPITIGQTTIKTFTCIAIPLTNTVNVPDLDEMMSIYESLAVEFFLCVCLKKPNPFSLLLTKYLLIIIFCITYT